LQTLRECAARRRRRHGSATDSPPIHLPIRHRFTTDLPTYSPLFAQQWRWR